MKNEGEIKGDNIATEFHKDKAISDHRSVRVRWVY